MGRRGITGVACTLLLLFCACSKRISLGEQCPAPGTPGSTLGKGAGTATVFGTGCAPCDGRVRYDERGCPVYETWASCGGAICIGPLAIAPPPDGGLSDAGDEDAGDEDAGSDDAGTLDRDGGQRDGSAQEQEDAGAP